MKTACFFYALGAIAMVASAWLGMGVSEGLLTFGTFALLTACFLAIGHLWGSSKPTATRNEEVASRIRMKFGVKGEQ